MKPRMSQRLQFSLVYLVVGLLVLLLLQSWLLTPRPVEIPMSKVIELVRASKGVIIMAATNRPEVVDQALLWPGRFDRQVVVDRPDVRGREAVLRLHARAVVLGPGADLANIVNEAALLAARKEKAAVEMADFPRTDSS